MQTPDLDKLKQRSSHEWDLAFAWLWPNIFSVVQSRLGDCFAADVEDVAVDSLEALVDKVAGVGSVEELRLVSLGIARNKAVDFLRRQLAVKRGAGMTSSLDETEANQPEKLISSAHLPSTEPDARELAVLLRQLLGLIGLRERQLLTDFYVDSLSYSEMAEKHSIPIGSVGVLLARARDKVQKIMRNNPRLVKELEGFLR